jgi:DNA mismatch endonuclease (patch repair protein)
MAARTLRSPADRTQAARATNFLRGVGPLGPFPAHCTRRMQLPLARPPSSSAEASRRMQNVRRRDTKKELAVRSALHRTGLRFRVDFAPLPALPRRRADIVFPRKRVAVFVDGCFWHSCPIHATAAKANADWWRDKLAQNRKRDRQMNDALAAAGWTVVRVWEHEELGVIVARVVDAVTRSGCS